MIFMYIKSSQMKLCKGRKKGTAFVHGFCRLETWNRAERKHPASPWRSLCWDDSKPEATQTKRLESGEALFILRNGVRTMKPQRLEQTTITPTHGCSVYLSFLTAWWPWDRQTSYMGALSLKHKCPRRQGERCMSPFMHFHHCHILWMISESQPTQHQGERTLTPHFWKAGYQEMCAHWF